MAKILVIDDEPDLRDLLGLILHYAGHEVITGVDGLEAIELTRSAHPDLLLLDIRMPRMNGYEACQKIKTDPATASIPVIFLSAKGQNNEVAEGLAAGAEEYLIKPFLPDQLIACIGKVLARHRKETP